MKTMITGVRPTGSITLANYIGGIKGFVEQQDKYNSLIFIADIHGLTTYIDPKEIRNNILDITAMYLACGIDPSKNIIYLQSDIEYIPSISWLLECNSYYGELSRMIQFKEKSKKNANFTSGLLTYPVLMSADILTFASNSPPRKV